MGIGRSLFQPVQSAQRREDRRQGQRKQDRNGLFGSASLYKALPQPHQIASDILADLSPRLVVSYMQANERIASGQQTMLLLNLDIFQGKRGHGRMQFRFSQKKGPQSVHAPIFCAHAHTV